MGQIGSSLDGKWRLPEYHPLDMGRNEIRLLTVQSSSLRKTGVEYTLEYVSLDDYTPEYADFLRQGGAELPSHHRSLVWEIITVQPEYPELADTMWEGLPPYVRKESLRQACNGKQFSGASRWVWGDFAALSYEWGDLKSPSKIVVDNISVSVTRNLSDALKNIHKVCQVRSANFRGSDATRIWVDALCINQLDIAERNLQVKRMNRIYADAGRVFIWTGPAWKNAKTFSEIMNDILVSSVEIDLPVQEGESAKATELRTWFRSIVENPIWREGMLNLMDRTYFSRLWIIQEIVLANSTAEVFFGSFSCPLSAVSASYSLIGGSFSLFVKDFPASMSESVLTVYSNISSLMELVKSRYKGFDAEPQPPLETLMAAGRLAKQRDLRDKVYAMIGLMDPEIERRIRPDYDLSSSLEHVYQQFMVSVIQATKRLDMIYQGASNPIRNESLPSWVPDWSIPLRHTDDPADSYYASHRASGDTVHNFVQEIDPTHLACKGFKFDELYSLACSSSPWTDHDEHDCYSYTGTPSKIETTGEQVLTRDTNSTRGSSGSKNVYGDDEKAMLTAFWTTILMGGMPLSADEILDFFQSIPWLHNIEEAQKVGFFSVVNRFQQCNKEVAITGDIDIANFFPSRSSALPELVIDSGIYFVTCLALSLLRNRKFITTKRGYFGMAPSMAEPTDEIFIVAGCNVPLLLRPVGDSTYLLVGECYVQGIMEGESVTSDVDWASITLV